MKIYRTGHIADSKDYGYPKHHHLMAIAPTLPTPNHIPFRKGLIWQANVGMCVGMSFKRCDQLWLAMAGFADEPMASGMFAYGIGRSQEYAGMDPDTVPPLQDVGTEPGLVLQAGQNVGIVSDEDYPDPTSPNWDPSAVNARPGPDALVKAYDARGLTFSDVLPDASGLKQSIRNVMVRRQPIKIAMFVDSGVMNNTGEIVTSIDRSDPQGGGHEIAFLDASRDDYAVLDNWWDCPQGGDDWGVPEDNPYGLPRGVWRISWELLETRIQQIHAVTSVPRVRKQAA